MKKKITDDFYAVQSDDDMQDCNKCQAYGLCMNGKYQIVDCAGVYYKKKTKVPQHIEEHLKELMRLYRYAQKWYMLLNINDNSFEIISNYQIIKNAVNYALRGKISISMTYLIEYKKTELFKKLNDIKNGK